MSKKRTRWAVSIPGKKKYVQHPSGSGLGWTYDRAEAEETAKMAGGVVVDADEFAAEVNRGLGFIQRSELNGEHRKCCVLTVKKGDRSGRLCGKPTAFVYDHAASGSRRWSCEDHARKPGGHQTLRVTPAAPSTPGAPEEGP